MTFNKSVNLKVNGMHCGGCANKVKKSLDSLNIPHSVEINVEKGLVNINYNSEQTTIAVLKKSIEENGFQVESIELE